MSIPYLVDIRDPRYLDSFGQKGAGLYWLQRHKYVIPETIVLTYAAGERIASEGERGLQAVINLLADRIRKDARYAVRSSANVEDDRELSFAGQFVSRTNVEPGPAMLVAVQEVFESGRAQSLAPYLQKIGETGNNIRMAILVQEMVNPVLSGVVFSKNPTTGLDEVVIEAVHGLGEALMQDGVTPNRWIYRWGQFTAKPDSDAEFEPVMRGIAEQARRIAGLYGAPVDLEWAFDGSDVYWLQIRPITALTNVPLYSNRISREVLPGIIKPLIASINIPLVNTAWIRLFDSLMGPTYLKPEELTRLFHYRAYFNMGSIGTIFEILGFPREGLEMLLGFERTSKRPPFSPSLKTFRHIPRLLHFAIQAWSYDKRVAGELDEFSVRIRQLQSESVSLLTEQELLLKIDDLYEFNLNVAYHNIVIPILMSVYNAILKSQLKRAGVEFVDFNLTEGMTGLEEYDPNLYLERIKAAFEALSPGLQEAVRNCLPNAGYAQLRNLPALDGFDTQLQEFLRRFGHLSDSGNDFSRVPWRETPENVIRMALDHTPNPRASQQTGWGGLKVSWLRKFFMRPYYQRGRRFRLKREQISSLYTASYGWFRVYFNVLAHRLRSSERLEQVEDIYYATWAEIRSLVEGTLPAGELGKRIALRKEEIEQCRELALPEIIYGNTAPPINLMKAGTQQLRGIPSSSGYFQGRLKIVQSTDDFGKVEKGDVIAIPYSDVAWTPLFARAGAVIAESGGMLSHSSIVAREYGIPCVVSVNRACNLPEDCQVIVDGYQGVVHLVE